MAICKNLIEKKMIQSELELEADLVQQLTTLGYEKVKVTNADELRINLKQQLEIHNNITLSDREFSTILNHLDKGNVFQKAKTLRDKFQLTRDDNSSCYIEFLNTRHWCQNQYQVTHQVSIKGKYKNRYDVTLLINGLPLVQIELKRRGMELKEAFNQINRYQRHSFWSENGLFQYVQLFVISNGVNTKYFANNRRQDFKQTFYWADKDNNLITKLDEFANCFLEKCHLSKMISQYIVLHESDKIPMVLRPYQYYAVEAIINRVKKTNKNGYIWHTTGSGKTLTSFKTAQILTSLPQVHKVIFVVDRADLDYQTTREFNFFSDGCVDGTNNTKALVKQLIGDNQLIVTTIQKLNTAINKTRYESILKELKDQPVVFIFDECHRSQFGTTHKKIKQFFSNAQMFGFTGTPIFKDNAIGNEHGKRTTKDLFDECLHKYVITNAISDENVLKFSIEYWGKLKRKDGSLIDEKVPALNIKEFYDNPERIDSIVDWIINHHNRKTHNKKFSAIMCVSSVDALITYYETFKAKQQQGLHDLRVITIFTPGVNESDRDADGLIGDPDFEIQADNSHSRDKLESFVTDYNQLYQTQHSVKDSKAFYTYYKDIAKRIKERDKVNFQDKDRVDILLVVNMYLTGFDAKKVNTLYVDKNLKYHGLIQAYSRTNRILGELKSQGNIVCFRNLKPNTDKAIALFSDPNARETIFIEPYKKYVTDSNKIITELKTIANDSDAVNQLVSEDDKLNFVKTFRKLIRSLNIQKSFTEFSWQDLNLKEQEFEDYKSKYLDIYDSRNSNESGTSILEEVDFELELIQRDDINVSYILKLLKELQNNPKSDYQNNKQGILEILNKETQLRSKRELIEKFINHYLPKMKPNLSLETEFIAYWKQEKEKATFQLCQDENMEIKALQAMINHYNFSEKEPLRDTVFAALKEKPKVLQRKKIYKRVVSKIKELIETFEDDIVNYDQKIL